MDPFILVTVAIVSIIVNIILVIVLRLQPLWGDGDILLDIAGMTFQFNRSIRRAIETIMDRDEQLHIRHFAECDLAVVKATNRHRAAPTAKTQERLKHAQEQYVSAQIVAQDAYRQAAYRWLLSAKGQEWCADRGIVFPPHHD